MSCSKASVSERGGVLRCPNCGDYGAAYTYCNVCEDSGLTYCEGRKRSSKQAKIVPPTTQAPMRADAAENGASRVGDCLPLWTRTTPAVLEEGSRVILLNRDAIEKGGLMGVITKKMMKMVTVTQRTCGGRLMQSRRYPSSLVRLGHGVTCRQLDSGEWMIVRTEDETAACVSDHE